MRWKDDFSTSDWAVDTATISLAKFGSLDLVVEKSDLVAVATLASSLSPVAP